MVDKKRVYWPHMHVTCINALLKGSKGWIIRLRYISLNIYIKLRPRCKYNMMWKASRTIFDLFYLLGQAEMLLNFTGPRFFHVVFH